MDEPSTVIKTESRVAWLRQATIFSGLPEEALNAIAVNLTNQAVAEALQNIIKNYNFYAAITASGKTK